MISRSTSPGTRVFHETLGFGIFKGLESEIGAFYGYAIINFDNHSGFCYIHPKKLTEIMDK